MSVARMVATLAVAAALVAGCGETDEDSPPSVTGELDSSTEPSGDDTASAPSEGSTAGEDDAGDDAEGDQPDESAPDVEGTADADSVDPADACTVTATESRIEIVHPVVDAELPRTFRLAGCGNTFEATYLWEFELDDGTVAGQGVGTMSCGSGCVGVFDEEVTVDGGGDGLLRVFEESAEDGSRVNVVEVDMSVTAGP